MDKLGNVPPAGEITPEGLYLRRREFMRSALLFTATAAGVGGGLLWLTKGGRATPREPDSGGAGGGVPAALTVAGRSPLSIDEAHHPVRGRHHLQ